MDVSITIGSSPGYLFSFVLLYYKDYENTIKCIESLLKLDFADNKVKIVIVDNCSNDGGLDKLRVCFNKNKNIYYIENEYNLGFARGNNVGIDFARSILKSDFVVAINTDTVIDQADFCQKTAMVYENIKYDVMGPRVKGYYSGEDQNPIYATYEQNTNKKILKDGIRWILWMVNIAKYIERCKKFNNKFRREKAYLVDRYKCVCSGCCVIFSPHFFKTWRGFYPGTFLYREESILFYIVNKSGGKTYFSDEVIIRHKGGESTSKEFGKDARKRNLRVYAHRLKSLKKEYKLKKMSIEELRKQI